MAIGAVFIGGLVVVLLYWLFQIKITTVSVKTPLASISDIPAKTWTELSQKRIYFAHMSVGHDILEGVQNLVNESAQIALDIVEGKDRGSPTRPAILHSEVGRNTEPLAKISDFKAIVREIGDRLDMAMLKFCYVDVRYGTDLSALFNAYRLAVAELQDAFPELQIMHMTVPLCSMPATAKSKTKFFVNQVLKRPTVLDDNVQRLRYNEMVRQEFGQTNLFDLAFVESISPDNVQYIAKTPQDESPFLLGEYTYDGGHLNDAGKRHVGTQFLLALAKGNFSL